MNVSLLKFGFSVACMITYLSACSTSAPHNHIIIQDIGNSKTTVATKDNSVAQVIPQCLTPHVYNTPLKIRKDNVYCTMYFDVNTAGEAWNIRVEYCSFEEMKQNAIESVEMWEYDPKITNGIATGCNNMRAAWQLSLDDAREIYEIIEPSQ